MDGNDVVEIDKVKKEYREISRSSILNSIKMMFFRHQHILRILSKIIVSLNSIREFSTSKVDIFVNY